MSSREFAEWQAYYKLEPFGDERADYRAAMIVQVLANAFRNRKDHPEPYDVMAFMPKFGGSVTEDRDNNGEQSVEAMAAMIALWNSALGGEVK